MTNYVSNECRLVKDMIRSSGLPYTGYLSKQTTHLICKWCVCARVCVHYSLCMHFVLYSEGGKKIDKAKEWGLKIVNFSFIGDVIFSKC